MKCTKRGSVCVFDETSDKRRKCHESKMEEELNYYRSFLDDFFEAIRDSNDDDVQHIIDIVRSGSSTGEIQFGVKSILAGNDPSRPAA